MSRNCGGVAEVVSSGGGVDRGVAGGKAGWVRSLAGGRVGGWGAVGHALQKGCSALEPFCIYIYKVLVSFLP